MLFTGLWWDQLIKLDINLATRLVLSQSLEFNYGNFKTGSLETTRGLRTCCCPTGISKTYGIGCHCCHQLSAGSAVWDVSAHVPCSARNGPNANAISPWKWFSWGIPPTAWRFMAEVRMQWSDVPRICTGTQKPGTSVFQPFPRESACSSAT